MAIPQFLKKGDKVGIICTARKITTKELHPAVEFLSKCGLIGVLGNSINKTNHQFGGTDKQRAEDFQNMLDNPDIKAIWCARGGYGTVRIIDAINFSEFKKNPKWILGYSDPTVLHCHIHNMDIATIHGQMCLEIDKKSEATRSSLKQTLLGKPKVTTYVSKNELNRQGKTKGQLIGGNLSVISSILGSDSMVDTKGKILFLEDLDEYLYHIDRMMQNLKRNSILDNLAGLIVGGFTDMNDNSVPFGKNAEQIIADSVAEFDYPVCFDFPAGHGHDNHAIIFGAETALEVTNSKITLETLNL